MSVQGIIFDIKEFSVHDGPGPRTTVFLKGCPLRCRWCHNPEGLLPAPQLMVRENHCTHCGRCRTPCSHPDCQPFGRCLHACPRGLIHVAGRTVDSDELAKELLRAQDFFDSCGGGITVSGGEPLMQPEFLCALLDALHGVHRCVETSGYASEAAFAAVRARTELLIMDIKLADPAQHRRWTGVDNAPVLRNLAQLQSDGRPFIIRTPLIPGVCDTADHLRAIAALLRSVPGFVRWELLPYNTLAGAKYPMVGKTPPEFSASSADPTALRQFCAQLPFPAAVL